MWVTFTTTDNRTVSVQVSHISEICHPPEDGNRAQIVMTNGNFYHVSDEPSIMALKAIASGAIHDQS